MYVIDGFTHYEIADALAISVGTSKSSLSRARTLLQKYIKEEEKVTVWSL
jgi:DNA-directed RNA polymerase specialized sigma24 family protein